MQHEFIFLTDENGDEVLVNASAILTVKTIVNREAKQNKNYSQIELKDGSYLWVQQTIKDIYFLITDKIKPGKEQK